MLFNTPLKLNQANRRVPLKLRTLKSEIFFLIYFIFKIIIINNFKYYFRDSVTISWKKPDDDGGKEVTSYVVEKRDKKTDKWERVQDYAPGMSCVIPKLKEGHEYDFRVIAENQNGQSEALETDHPTKAKNPFGINNAC